MVSGIVFMVSPVPWKRVPRQGLSQFARSRPAVPGADGRRDRRTAGVEKARWASTSSR